MVRKSLQLITLFAIFFSYAVMAENQKQGKIPPANVLLVCALQQNRAAFATDPYGNLSYCINNICSEVLQRPGNAKPVSLSCINQDFVYIYYSNNKLYRCHTVGSCTVLTMLPSKYLKKKNE